MFARRLVVVEAAKRWDGLVAFPFVCRSQIDPMLERSLFVYTKFALQLQLFVLPDQLPSYLAQVVAPRLSVFVTLPNPSQFDDSLHASEALQQNVLAQFRFDEELWASKLSLVNLLVRLHRMATNVFVEEVFPAALVRFEAEAARCIDNYKVRCQNAELNLSVEARKAVSAHLARAAARFVRLACGSSSEATGLGLTASEEQSQIKAPWTVHRLGAEPVPVSVLFSNCKLLAGARWQRLIDEFELMMRHAASEADKSSESSLSSSSSSSSSSVPVALPGFVALVVGENVERRVAALNSVVLPALATLRLRLLALVKELIQTANRSALESVAPDSVEGIVLNRCKLQLTVEAVTALAEQQLSVFAEKAKDAVLLNSEADIFHQRISSLLAEVV